jgi:hypothetical protein
MTCNGADTCLAGTCDQHADDCAPNPTEGSQGGMIVCGFGALPNQPAGCIQLFDCGPDMMCNTPDDILLGSSGTGGTGQFCVTTTVELTCRQHVFTIDTCAMPTPLVGDDLFIRCEAPVPLLSPTMALALITLLSFVGFFGLRRLRRSPTR